MTTSSLSAIDSVLTQMRSVAKTAANAPITTTVNTSSPSGFAGELQRSMDRLAATQNSANAQAESFVAGTSTASLNDVMIDLQKASLAFQTSVQVRNRLVQAYQSVASMPV
ncbi:flagellar hook-basal body complex protein FliE [uncultured Paenalcaligenes sp.]|uniref:flagellar hook-basal body complex protein FliE n=1 Tax=uncultured Paenalcaligenes sp. TaxID=1588925 RepID=UPI002613FA58|nr:flagellar hook-basal body complex protein FliE [uncultured Paenalcaligenes sp.]